jgi:cellulose synthase operon protein C
MWSRVNWRRLLVLVGALVLMGIGVHLLHGYEAKSNAAMFLRAADQAKALGQSDKALDMLGRYLGFRPDDAEAAASHALLLGNLARNGEQRQRAFLRTEAALRRLPDRQDLRRQAATLARDMKRFADGKHHLQILMQACPGDGELEDLLAQCEEAAGQRAAARDLYLQATQHRPDRVEAYIRLANLYRRQLDLPHEAAQVLDRMVEANPENLEARLARANDRKQGGNLEGAEEDLTLVREKLAPDQAEFLLASAELAAARNQPDQARMHYQRGTELYPKEQRFLVGLAELELRRAEDGRPQALDYLKKAHGLMQPNQESELLQLANLFIDAGATGEARPLLNRLQASRSFAAPAGLLQARLLLVEGKPGDAVALIEQVRPDLAGRGEWTRRAEAVLSVGYERLGNPEQQLAAAKRLLKMDPTSLPVRLRHASSLVAAERVSQAIGEYRTLIDEVPETRLILSSLLLAHNLRLPPNRQDWAEPEKVLAGVPDDLKRSADYRVRRLELLLAQNKMAEARAAVEDGLEAEPKELRFWLVKATLAGRAVRDKPNAREEFQKVLLQAEAQVGDRAELRLARAEMLSRELPPGEAAAALRKLEENLPAFSPTQQATLYSGLANVYLRLASNDEARRLFRRTADLQPDNWAARLVMLDLALRAGDEREAQLWKTEIRRIEGEEGAAWRLAEVILLVAKPQEFDRPRLAQARKRLAEVRKRRPDWSRLSVAEGQIDEREGKPDAAIDHYLQAIDLGENQPDVVRRAVQLLVLRRRPEDAKALLETYQQEAGLTADLSRLATQVAFQTQEQTDRTLELAARAVSKDSKEPQDHLWLGQVFWAAGRNQEAEKAFRRARDLDPKATDAWVSLTVFLVRSDDKPEAEAEVKKAAAALSKDQLSYVLVPYYSALGEREKAEEQYLRILEPRKDDPVLLQALANFYTRRGEPEKAEPYVRKLMERPPHAGDEYVAWARRNRTLQLALTGDYRRTAEALDLVRQNLEENPNSPEDLRARAAVLAVRPGDRKTAIRDLEASFGRLRPTPVEALLLAQLHEVAGDWPRAEDCFRGLVTSPGGDAPQYLASYVRALLRHEDVAQAAFWADKLRSTHPGHPLAVEMQVQVLKAQGEKEEAGRLGRTYAEQEYAKRKDPALLRGGALLLEQLDRFEDAEALFRRLIKEAGDRAPEAVLELASFLARRGRLSEALDLCDRAWAAGPPASVGAVSVAALRSGQPGENDFRRVEGALAKALAKQPDNLTLLTLEADLLVLRGRNGDAEAAYRAVLQRAPDNTMALNNLAWLLSGREAGRPEALQRINQAIAAAGPQGTLLDTRGLIRLWAGQAVQAVPDFEAAVAEAPTGIRWFHLALACQANNDRRGAERAWQKARGLGLKETDLPQTEREGSRRLAEALGPH